MLRITTQNWVAVAVLLSANSLVHADYIANVSMDTTAFQNYTAGAPFTVIFDLVDGSNGIDGVNNNTATITNFSVDGGSLDSSTTMFGGTATSTTGDLTGTVTMTDSNTSLSYASEQFAPGSKLSFTLDLTTNVSNSEQNGPVPFGPDSFGFTILDQFGNSYSSNLLTGNFLDISITGANPSVTPSGGSIPGVTPGIAPPMVSPLASAPEPSTLVLLFTGAVFAGAASARKRYATRKGCTAPVCA